MYVIYSKRGRNPASYGVTDPRAISLTRLMEIGKVLLSRNKRIARRLTSNRLAEVLDSR